MKTLFLWASLCLLALSGCKKDNVERTIQVQITIPAYTTYNIHVNNGSTPVFNIDNASASQNASLTAPSGSKLSVVFGFATTGYQYGQGTAIFTYNGQTLLTLNGGQGNETIDVP